MVTTKKKNEQKGVKRSFLRKGKRREGKKEKRGERENLKGGRFIPRGRNKEKKKNKKKKKKKKKRRSESGILESSGVRGKRQRDTKYHGRKQKKSKSRPKTTHLQPQTNQKKKRKKRKRLSKIPHTCSFIQ